MMTLKGFTRQIALVFMTIGFYFVMGDIALAEEGGGGWRGTFDKAMLWVNFSILVFLFIKFAKNPLKNFLKSQQDEVADEIGGLENKRDELMAEIKAVHEDLDQSKVRLDGIKEKIITQGERKKQSILENATEQSRLMMEGAKQKIESEILRVKTGFREDMIDAAMDLATEKIAGYINDVDNEKFVKAYLSGTGAE
jgi:F-type H+-transporting ATPase subunit b